MKGTIILGMLMAAGLVIGWFGLFIMLPQYPSGALVIMLGAVLFVIPSGFVFYLKGKGIIH